MVTHKNLRHVTSREWFDELWEAGARFGFLLDYVPIGPDAPESLILTDEDRAYKADVVERRLEERRPAVVNFPPAEYVVGACQAAGDGMIHINADGLVEPCPFSHFAADSVLDKPLEEILGSPFLRALRDEMLEIPNPRSECLLASHESQVRAIAERTNAFQTDRPGAVRGKPTGH
jgi:MoaA/NifB/PqqE/SkfB family radical SAM enzyme